MVVGAMMYVTSMMSSKNRVTFLDALSSNEQLLSLNCRICIFSLFVLGYFIPVSQFLQCARSPVTPGNGLNEEFALHLLHMCRGNVEVRNAKIIYDFICIYWISYIKK